MSSEVFFRVVLPFLSLLFGALVTYCSNRFLHQRNARKQRSIELYEEFHSEDMLKCRFDAIKVLKENPEGNIVHLYTNLPVESYLPLSKLFHWIEKVGVYEKNKQVETSLLRDLLGRYFYDWYTLHYKRLTADLPKESEFVDMMKELKYVAKKMGKLSDARYFSQGGGA